MQWIFKSSLWHWSIILWTIWTLSFHHYTCPPHVWDKNQKRSKLCENMYEWVDKKCYGIKTKLYCKSILIISSQIFVRWMKAIFGFKKWIGFIPIDENNNGMMMIDTHILHKNSCLTSTWMDVKTKTLGRKIYDFIILA